jgi:hypothetical protein
MREKGQKAGAICKEINFPYDDFYPHYGGPGFLGHAFLVIDRDQGERGDERRFQEV